MQVTSIYEPIQEEMARVEERLADLADLPFQFLSELLSHVLDGRGKRVRPALTLLAASFHPHDRQKMELLAASVELLHLATLIHDDTVDESDVRRGRATVSRLWGRDAAVLLGDYIFASSAAFVCDTGNIQVIRRCSETIVELSTGELQEMAESNNPHQTMEQYLERIYKKTASLFTTAGETGAILSGAPGETVGSLKSYSYNLGMAFQIVDDILDFDGTEQEVGKPVGSDLAQGTITLPAILALERYPEDNPIAALAQRPGDRECIQRAVEIIQDSTIIQDSYAIAQKFSRKATDALADLPATPSRDSLYQLADFLASRRQ